MSQRKKEQQRPALMPCVTRFQIELGPHVQFNQVGLSENYFSCKMGHEFRVKDLQMATKGDFNA